MGIGTRCDEYDSRGFASARECGVLGQKSVAGMDGIDLLLAGERDDAFDVEIGLNGSESLADLIGFVGLEAVEAEAVFAGIDGYRAQPEFGRRPHDADRNLTTV